MRWFITGGCGFVGTNLARSLLDAGESVTLYDDMSVGDPPDSTDLVVITGDVKNKAMLCNEALGCDIFVHLAAATSVIQSVENPEPTCETNIMVTLNALIAA